MSDAITGKIEPVRTGGFITILLCMLTAMNEGLDIQAAGVAAPRLAQEFGLDAAQLGYLLTACSVGLLVGAAIGGRLADHLGRKKVLIASMILFGLFSLGNATAVNYESLLTMRLLTGIGLGGAVPNLIALAAEASPVGRRNTFVSLTAAGLPLGGILAGLLAVVFPSVSDWRMVFYVGGVAPLVLAGILAWAMPESLRFREIKAEGIRPTRIRAALFGGGRFPATILLSSAFFCAFLLLYLMLSWLPSLMVAKGFSSAGAGWIQAAFNLGGAAGGMILGRLMDHGGRKFVMALAWIGIAGALAALVQMPPALIWACVVGATAGFFVTGTQLTLYGLTSGSYAAAHRGTGIGFAVAFGRIGSVVGPLGGAALIAGNPDYVLVAMLSVALVGGTAAVGATFLRNLDVEGAASRKPSSSEMTGA